MDIKVIYSDVDGTLLNSNHKITSLTLKSIKEAIYKSIKFVIVSARSPSGIYPILNENGLRCPIICFSGALILSEEKEVLYHKGFSKEIGKKIIHFIDEKKFDTTVCIYSLNQWIVNNKNDERVQNEERIVQASAEQGTIDDIQADAINKILCISSPETTIKVETALKQAFPELSIVKSSNILLEIMEKGINKATAIGAYCHSLNVDKKETIAFGDNYNDEEMLLTVGHGYLMGNAPAALKRKLKNKVAITLSNDNDGIYNILRDIV